MQSFVSNIIELQYVLEQHILMNGSNGYEEITTAIHESLAAISLGFENDPPTTLCTVIIRYHDMLEVDMENNELVVSHNSCRKIQEG